MMWNRLGLVQKFNYTSSLLLLSCCSSISYGYESHSQNSDNSFMEAMQNGSAGVNFRLRHENARQGTLKHAQATTLRTKVSYNSAKFSDANLYIEVVDVSNFLGQKYNANVDGLQKTDYATIADPKGTGVTNGHISYTGLEATKIVLGRQYIRLDDERFVGKVNFRQFPQSFDAISIKNDMLENLDFFYAYASNVNTTNANGRTNNGRRKLHTHLVNLGWSGFQYGKITGYTYFNKDRTVTSNSHALLGIKFAGDEAFKETFGWSYSFNVARQQAKFNNPNRHNANYLSFDLTKNIDILEGSIGYERLSGKSNTTNQSFNIPLGTNHKFLGWADVFLTTPDRGIQDLYATVSGDAGQIKLVFAYHHFRFQAGGDSRKAGNEIDLSAGMRLSDSVSFSAAYANFNPSNSSAPKTRRVWLTLGAKFL